MKNAKYMRTGGVADNDISATKKENTFCLCRERLIVKPLCSICVTKSTKVSNLEVKAKMLRNPQQ